MRTTLDVDDDVLQAAKELARRHKKAVGKMLSELARRGLTLPQVGSTTSTEVAFLGFEPFPGRGGLVTNELINQIRATEAGE